MNSVPTELVRESFERQLAMIINSGTPYTELFVIHDQLKEELFKEFCELDLEPDHATYVTWRLKQEGLLMDEVWTEIQKLTPISKSKKSIAASLEQKGDKELLLERINQEFINYKAVEVSYKIHFEATLSQERIPQEFTRPQLDKSNTIKLLREIEAWRDDLVVFLLNAKRDDYNSEISGSTYQIVEILKRMNFGYRRHLSEIVIKDDLSEDISNQIHLSKPESGDIDVEVRDKQRGWRNFRVHLQKALNDYKRDLEIHPLSYLEQNRSVILRKCEREKRDGMYLLSYLKNSLDNLGGCRLDEEETRKIIALAIADLDNGYEALFEHYLLKAVDADRSFNNARITLLQNYNRDSRLAISIRIIDSEVIRKLVSGEISNDEAKKAEYEIPTIFESGKLSTALRGSILDDSIQDARKECNQIPGQPSPIEIKRETKREAINNKLVEYGFFDIEKVKILSEVGRKSLVNLVALKSLPYRIALFDFLGFLTYLSNEHFNSKHKRAKAISSWFNSDKDGRSVRGNIDSLVKPVKRYTSYKHKETVRKDYQSLK